MVTQYIQTGWTIGNFCQALVSVGLDYFDIASLDTAELHTAQRKIDRNSQGYTNLYSGQTSHKLAETHESFSGVRKASRSDYHPYLLTMLEGIAKAGRIISWDEEKEIFEINARDSSEVSSKKFRDPKHLAELERRKWAPVTEKEKRKIKETIRFAREDTNLLADRVIAAVWGTE